MRRFPVLLAVLALSLAAVPADEGMWRLDQLEQLDWDAMKARGLRLGPEEVRGLARAVVKISMGRGYGTGSFVSDQGLILTNHHVAHQCISTNSDVEENLLEKGFLAESREEEIPCRGFEVLRALSMRDVTSEVQKPEDASLDPFERYKKREARRNRLATECQGGREDRRCQVVPFYGGAQEMLVRYQVIRDVRLVHAPERALGVFGGDIDNFEWPRHTLDYSLLRAYDAGGAPFHPDVSLKISLSGYTEGSFVMALGYPGSTRRYLPAAELAFQTEEFAPRVLDRIRSVLAVYRKHAARDEATRLALIDSIRGLANAEKYYSGMLAGLQRMHPDRQRRRMEEDLAAWIAADPERRKRYGDLLPAIEDLARRQRETVERQMLFSRAGWIRSLGWAYALYERSVERELPDDQRHDPYHDRQEPALRLRIVETPRKMVPQADEELLAGFIADALRLPEDQRIDAVAKRAQGREGTPEEVARRIAAELVSGTKVGDPETRRRYFEASKKDLLDSGDPMILFAADLHAQRRPFEDRLDREITAPAEELSRRYAAALMEFRGGNLYADANATLRFTHGRVLGYFPYGRGSRLGYATTAGSMMAAVTDHPDYALRDEVKAQLAGRKLDLLVDPFLGNLPIDFVADIDTTGGNSGSPVLDGTGRVLGVLFDGNFEGLASDLAYDGEHDRSIMVDVRAILHVMLSVYGAVDLAAELGL
ncbi:MAG: S46 family peptidase [Acidobacteria bacterium]|nr:MAG: S46 family peptidase [Acidobacteriota bacterium]